MKIKETKLKDSNSTMTTSSCNPWIDKRDMAGGSTSFLEPQGLLLNGIALITTWWYMAARAAPMNGPTQKIH